MKTIATLCTGVGRLFLCPVLALVLSSCGGPSLDFDFDYDPDYKVKGQEKYPSDFSSGKVYGDVEVNEKTRRVKGYVIDDEGSRKRVEGYIEDDGDIHVHDSDWKTCKLEKTD